MKELISVSKLEKCGWFEEYPADLRETIQRKVAEGGKVYDLSLLGGDVECIEEEGDYTKWYVTEFAANLCGLFTPEDIREHWRWIDPDTAEVTLSFTYCGKKYSNTFEQIANYANSCVLELMERAIEETGSRLRLVKLEIGGHDEYYALTTLDAYIAAYKSNLLPKWNYDAFNEASWPSDPEPLSLPWHLKKIQGLDHPPRQASPGLAQVWQHLKKSLKEAPQIHIVFAVALNLIILHGICWNSSLIFTSSNIGTLLSQFLLWAASYWFCLTSFPSVRNRYLFIAVCALYLGIFSYPIMGWFLLGLMYMKERARFIRFKKELRETAAELRSTPMDPEA